MKHIAIFNNSGETQSALNEETLLNPYVALVSGSGLDYNTLEPVPPVTGERKIEITFLPNGRGNYMLWNNIDAIPLDYAEWVDENSETHILHAGDSPSVELGANNEYKVTYHLTGNSIGPNAFRGITCVTAVEIFGGVEYLGSYSFANLEPTPEFPINIILHEGVKEIGYNDGGVEETEGEPPLFGRTFEGFSACTSVTIPSTVTLINTNSFSNFQESNFMFRGLTPPTFSMSESTDLGTGANVYVPVSAYQAYNTVLGPYLDTVHINTITEYHLYTLEDSEGNTYFGDYFPESDEYSIQFINLDVDSTWTLRKDGQVCSAETMDYSVSYECGEGPARIYDSGTLSNITCEDFVNADHFSIPPYDRTYYTYNMYVWSDGGLEFSPIYYQTECSSSSIS